MADVPADRDEHRPLPPLDLDHLDRADLDGLTETPLVRALRRRLDERERPGLSHAGYPRVLP